MEIDLEFLSYEDFKNKKPKEIISRLKKKNKIIIIPKKLKPEEETQLIEEVMKHHDIDTFSGIEIASMSKDMEKRRFKWLYDLLKKEEGITLIGNGNLIKEIRTKKNSALLKL